MKESIMEKRMFKIINITRELVAIHMHTEIHAH